MKYLITLIVYLALTLLAGCSKDPGEPPKYPGSFFPTYPCITCSDGSTYCSDVHKSTC